MCDEYEDERMRVFWRALADKEGLQSEQKQAPDVLETVPISLAAEPAAVPRPKATTLAR